jgi:hypothetical protein
MPSSGYVVIGEVKTLIVVVDTDDSSAATPERFEFSTFATFLQKLNELATSKGTEHYVTQFSDGTEQVGVGRCDAGDPAYQLECEVCGLKYWTVGKPRNVHYQPNYRPRCDTHCE